MGIGIKFDILIYENFLTSIVIEDLIQDFVSIITSFCARLYGQRRSKRKTERIIAELRDDKESNNTPKAGPS